MIWLTFVLVAYYYLTHMHHFYTGFARLIISLQPLRCVNIKDKGHLKVDF